MLGRWLGVRMVALGVTIVGVASSLSVVFRRTLTSGVVGLTISYALDVSSIGRQIIANYLANYSHKLTEFYGSILFLL